LAKLEAKIRVVPFFSGHGVRLNIGVTLMSVHVAATELNSTVQL